MDGVNNNQFEVKSNSKRKLVPSSNVYLNPALDLLANDDKICNTAMEIIPKKRKRTKSESAKHDVASFENTGLDIGNNKVVNVLLVKEIDNVRNNFKYGNIDSVVTEKNVGDVQNGSSMASTDNFVCEEIPNSKFVMVNPLIGNLTAEEIPNVECGITNDTKAMESFMTNEIPSVSHVQTEDHNNLSKIPFSHSVTNVDQTIDISKNGDTTEPVYANLAETRNEIDSTINCSDISRIPKDSELDSGISVLEPKSINNIQTNISNQMIINNSNISLSFIDRLALDSPSVSDQSLYLDDDLNESNIMEIKTITIITKKKRIVEKKNTNPFLDPNLKTDVTTTINTNPFLEMRPEIEYQEAMRPIERPVENLGNDVLMPRRLFDTNSTISTVNESIEMHEYENTDAYRVESPVYENIDDLNKQSKILGHDVSHFSVVDILNLNKTANNSNESKKEKSSFLKVGNKLSKKVFKTLKKTFKNEKVDINTSNPYEVPRKAPKQKEAKKESGIENPALNLDISDDLEIEELSDEEHLYETIKTKRNTEYNMNVTPLKARDNEIDFLPNKTNTPGKKVRFDSTLNREKVITGNSFDYGMQSPGFDAKIEKYHDELENCINERKFLQQNM